MTFDATHIAALIVGLAASVFLALTYFKAGKFKLTAPIETLVGAGLGWTAQIPAGLVRTIALLELAGAAGVILAPIATVVGLTWAASLAVAAAVGLILVMVVAIIMHGARKETKYTIKINLALLGAAVIATAGYLIAFFPAA